MNEKDDELIGQRIIINDIEWRVAQKTLKYGREWQYTLSHENVDGSYRGMNLNEGALRLIIESGSKVMSDGDRSGDRSGDKAGDKAYNFIGDWVLNQKIKPGEM